MVNRRHLVMQILVSIQPHELLAFVDHAYERYLMHQLMVLEEIGWLTTVSRPETKNVFQDLLRFRQKPRIQGVRCEMFCLQKLGNGGGAKKICCYWGERH